MLIYLALFSQTKSSEGLRQRHQPPLLAADWVCRAEFVAKIAGGLLPRRFTFAATLARTAVCFLLHFPLGRPSHLLDEIPVFCSSDFPLHNEASIYYALAQLYLKLPKNALKFKSKLLNCLKFVFII